MTATQVTESRRCCLDVAVERWVAVWRTVLSIYL